ncbi:MAG: RNA-binding transcriptional accessory protein, partial [Saprospiraceae bacterium]|nr:RNA-binding transcriptional accessory protein [Saprospiraceae bacterium]
MEKLIAQRLHIPENQVSNVIDLLDQGATVPFIARYRKEKTGSLDETIITSIQEEVALLKKLQLRKATIKKRLEELNVQNPDILDKINRCFDPTELEDIYLPYRPKRRTKAQVAREKGLEPLAKMVMSQRGVNWISKIYIHCKGKVSEEEATEGIKDIIAEWVNEHGYARKSIRQQYEYHALLISKVIKSKTSEASKYKDY